MNKQMMIRILILGLCIGISVQLSPPGPTSCQDLQASDFCLEKIRSLFNAESMFWWGDWFDSNCPSPKVYCSKPPQLSAGKTLKSALPGIDETKITKFLNVTYTSKAESYEGCDTTVTRNEPYTFSLDPTSNTKYRSWDARARPRVSWEATESEKYTLMMLDAGVGIVHGVWSNIADGVLPMDGTNLNSNINVAKKYNGPKNSIYEWPNPYIFLLFKQTQVNDITIDASNFTESFHLQTNLPSYMSTYGLEGPIAANWLFTEGDTYAAQFFININAMNNCPNFITNALKQPVHQGRPFLPADKEMSVFIHASLRNPPITYTICCETYTFKETYFKFDPIANPIRNAVETRSGGQETLTITFKKGGFNPNFTGERYTLVSVDPDVPNPASGTPSKPILHMLVTNIADGIFSTGDVLQPYAGPRNPEEKPHLYYFLLYKQKDAVEFSFNMTDVRRDYVESQTCGRCLFNINGFVDNNELELVGATWFSVPNNQYINYMYVQGGRNESLYCSDVDGWTYGQTCPTSCAQNIIVYATVLISSLIFSRVFL